MVSDLRQSPLSTIAVLGHRVMVSADPKKPRLPVVERVGVSVTRMRYFPALVLVLGVGGRTAAAATSEPAPISLTASDGTGLQIVSFKADARSRGSAGVPFWHRRARNGRQSLASATPSRDGT